MRSTSHLTPAVVVSYHIPFRLLHSHGTRSISDFPVNLTPPPHQLNATNPEDEQGANVCTFENAFSQLM